MDLFSLYPTLPFSKGLISTCTSPFSVPLILTGKFAKTLVMQTFERGYEDAVYCSEEVSIGIGETVNIAGFRLAIHRFGTLMYDHRLPFQSYSSQQSCCFGFITEQHHFWVEYNPTVCGLPLWVKQQGYLFIDKTLITVWCFLCGYCHFSSCTNITIKMAMQRAEKQQGLKDLKLENRACRNTMKGPDKTCIPSVLFVICI